MNSILESGIPSSRVGICRGCGIFLDCEITIPMSCDDCTIKNRCPIKFTDLAKISPILFDVAQGLCKKCKKGRRV